MEGSVAGSAADPLSTAARERAGAGCPATSAGMPVIAGTKGDEPLIVRTSPGRGSAGQTGIYAIPPGGEANGCN
ncbi:hypothetical protein ACFQY5_25075 [Paeniroseomonas aquatica]|uniref:hypothetical protein n=1 Tax=Paeniroseomonas aquatica TaxID=373043 RepID=UPI0025B61E0E|nr:hypothetical protein [Paeniroseomonas aquatica]